MLKKKRERTPPKILLYLATHREGNKWEIAQGLKKAYSNIHGAMKELLNLELIYVASRRRSERNPLIDVEYYGLTYLGLFASFGCKEIWEQIDSVAQVHSDKLLTFKKWQFFIEENLKEDIIENLKRTLESLVRADLSLESFFGQPLRIKKGQLPTVVDSMVLGCYEFTSLPKDERVLKIISACKKDLELRSFVENELKFFKKEAEHTLVQTQEAEKIWGSL